MKSLAIFAAALAVAGGHSVKGLDGKPIPLGQTLEINPPGFHAWLFRVKAGERYHVDATWPSGKLTVRVGTERLADDDDDDDEATGRRVSDALPAGPHRWGASWKVPAKANVAFVWVALAGAGSGPDAAIRVRLTRE